MGFFSYINFGTFRILNFSSKFNQYEPDSYFLFHDRKTGLTAINIFNTTLASHYQRYEVLLLYVSIAPALRSNHTSIFPYRIMAKSAWCNECCINQVYSNRVNVVYINELTTPSICIIFMKLEANQSIL